MKQPIVVIGLGELGELFASGFLKLGHPVFPILRGMDLNRAAAEIPAPELVLAAVGENDLHPVLESLPPAWRDCLALLQNELLPCDWLRHGIADPTVAVVWFDKKKGRPPAAPLPSLVAGPKAGLLVEALRRAEVPCRAIPPAELTCELAAKALYLLTVNIAGLALPPGATVAELWNRHRALAEAVAGDILDILQHLTQPATPPRQRLLAGMLEGFAGDWQHVCTGRSAPARLARMLARADAAGLAVPTLRGLAAGPSS